jgi:hypothetical protein
MPQEAGEAAPEKVPAILLERVVTTEEMSADALSDLPPRNDSPFLLSVSAVESLAQSDGFSILREHLAQHYDYE